MTLDELEMSYKGPITGTVVDSAENPMIENTTDELNRTVDMFAVDEYSDETDNENLLVMLSAKIMDNGGHTLSDWMTEAFDVSSHKKQYNDINTGAYHETTTMKDSPMFMIDDISDDQMDEINLTHMAPVDHEEITLTNPPNCKTDDTSDDQLAGEQYQEIITNPALDHEKSTLKSTLTNPCNDVPMRFTKFRTVQTE